MSDFRFQDPWWLLLAAPLLFVLWWSSLGGRRGAILYSHLPLVQDLPSSWADHFKRLLPALRILAAVLLVVAVARPQQGLREFRVRTEGVAIQMCLDRSGSMQAMDFELDGQRVNRLTAVKAVFRRFASGDEQLSGRPDDLIGLIAFGGFAENLAPLTLDRKALLEVLNGVQIPQPLRDDQNRVLNAELLEEELATAIGDAVAVAVQRLKNVPAKSKVIILLTDGENTAGAVEPDEAAEAARRFGVKIYAIGVGRNGRAPFPATDASGRQVLVSRFVRLDEETLQKMAATTDGEYYHAEDTAALERVYADIDRLEKTSLDGLVYSEYRELYLWFLTPAIVLLLLDITLRSTRFRPLP